MLTKHCGTLRGIVNLKRPLHMAVHLLSVGDLEKQFYCCAYVDAILLIYF